MKYFISELYPHARYTAGVLREDIEAVLLKNGYIQLIIPDTGSGLMHRINAYLVVAKLFFTIPAGSKLFFHFPVRSRAKRLLLHLLHARHYYTIGYLHDFDGIRDEDKHLLHKELAQLQSFSVLITQNKMMQQKVAKQFPNKKVVSIEMYDYLNAAPFSGKRTKNNELSFAGNPDKAAFIKQLSSLPQLYFFIYGTNILAVLGNCSFEGAIDPRALPGQMKGSFGLVWDGDSIATCSGGSGLYLRINTSHKIALYILATLPIVIWEEAAMAPWIVANGIGFTTPSLQAIAGKIALLSDAAYEQMCQKQKRLQQKIAAGAYLEDVLAGI